MYVRQKTVKGHIYHQVVEGVRTGDKVRQRVVVALGTTADPIKALSTMRYRLDCLRRWNSWPEGVEPIFKTLARRLAQSKRQIDDLERRIEILAGVLANGSLAQQGMRPNGR